MIKEVEGKSSTVTEGKGEEILMKVREWTVFNASNLKAFFSHFFQVFLCVNYVIIGLST